MTWSDSGCEEAVAIARRMVPSARIPPCSNPSCVLHLEISLNMVARRVAAIRRTFKHKGHDNKSTVWCNVRSLWGFTWSSARLQQIIREQQQTNGKRWEVDQRLHWEKTGSKACKVSYRSWALLWQPQYRFLREHHLRQCYFDLLVATWSLLAQWNHCLRRPTRIGTATTAKIRQITTTERTPIIFCLSGCGKRVAAGPSRPWTMWPRTVNQSVFFQHFRCRNGLLQNPGHFTW